MEGFEDVRVGKTVFHDAAMIRVASIRVCAKGGIKELPTGNPFATMGPYLRKSMLLTLAKAVGGDLDKDSEVNVLGTEGKELFSEKKMLGELEENEVARRIMEIKDKQQVDEYESDDDDDEE